MKLAAVLVALGLSTVVVAGANKPEIEGYKPAKRFSAVAISWSARGVHLHPAIDYPTYEEAWAAAVNKCGGVSRNCYVLESWGKYGCLAVTHGQSERGNWWYGKSLALLPPTHGNGAMKFMLEDAKKGAVRVCDFHAHYDEKGKIYDPKLSFSSGYCTEAVHVCSKEFESSEYESP